MFLTTSFLRKKGIKNFRTIFSSKFNSYSPVFHKIRDKADGS